MASPGRRTAPPKLADDQMPTRLEEVEFAYSDNPSQPHHQHHQHHHHRRHSLAQSPTLLPSGTLFRGVPMPVSIGTQASFSAEHNKSTTLIDLRAIEIL